MNGYELQRYLQDERVRAALEARARRARAETVQRLIGGAYRGLVRAIRVGLERLAAWAGPHRACARLRGCGCH